jgi:hypothetical protein
MYKIIGADQKEYGPVSADQIRQWISEGRVNGQTKVQAEGTTLWLMVADMPELASGLPKTPAPTAMTTMTMPQPSPAAPRGTSQMAVWSMVCGIFSVLCCPVFAPVAIVAIILGAIALGKINAQPALTGKGFAITGIALGIVALLLAAFVLVLWICYPQFFQNFPNFPQS